MIKDFRPSDSVSLIYRVKIDFGDHTNPNNPLNDTENPTPTNSNITFNWGNDTNGSLFDVFTEFTTAELVDVSDLLNIVRKDMKIETTHTFIPKEPNEVRTVFIILKKQVNTAPVAVDDFVATL